MQKQLTSLPHNIYDTNNTKWENKQTEKALRTGKIKSKEMYFRLK